MKLYVDDDSAAAVLVRLLRDREHDVQTPAEVGMVGETDAVHLTHAIRQRRAQLTRNYQDFEDLHYLILESAGHHPGILTIRSDNDSTRDLSPRAICAAIAKLEESQIPVKDSLHVLNHWR
jgi:hypothetical protein